MKIRKVVHPVYWVVFPWAYVRALWGQYQQTWSLWRGQGVPFLGRLVSLFFNAWAFNILWVGSCEMARISALSRDDSHWLRDTIFEEAHKEYAFSRSTGCTRRQAFRHAWSSIWYGPVSF